LFPEVIAFEEKRLAFNTSYRVNGGDWVTTIFRNKPGG